MKNRIYAILPRYAMLPLVILVVYNLLVWNGVRLLNLGRVHHDFSIAAIDGVIPFFRPMILVYVLSYVFWIVGYIVIGRENREVCYRIFASEFLAKTLCLLFFLAIPTYMNGWPSGSFPINNFFDRMTQLIYDCDRPDNLFPSIHCLESWFVFRGALQCKKVGKVYKVYCLLFALAVFASTVLLKQHVFLDIIGGVVVAEAGILLCKCFRADRAFYALESVCRRKEGVRS